MRTAPGPRLRAAREQPGRQASPPSACSPSPPDNPRAGSGRGGGPGRRAGRPGRASSRVGSGRAPHRSFDYVVVSGNSSPYSFRNHRAHLTVSSTLAPLGWWVCHSCRFSGRLSCLMLFR